MMDKFRSSIFGAPEKVKGVSVPMDASVSQLGRVTYFGAVIPGVKVSAELGARQQPKQPTYADKVVMSNGEPPRVVQNRSLFQRIFNP